MYVRHINLYQSWFAMLQRHVCSLHSSWPSAVSLSQDVSTSHLVPRYWNLSFYNKLLSCDLKSSHLVPSARRVKTSYSWMMKGYILTAQSLHFPSCIYLPDFISIGIVENYRAVALMFAVKCYALRMFFPSSVTDSYVITYHWNEFNQKLLADYINTWNSEIY
jgi:hypothetical protein